VLDKRAIEAKYTALKKELNGLSPDTVLAAYFESSHRIVYPTVFEDFGSLATVLHQAGCRIAFINVFEHGREMAQTVVEAVASSLDAVELYNTQDCAGRPTEEIESFARFINALNARAQAEGRAPLQPICGSDATGRNPKIPGMGFIFEDQVIGKLRKKYLKRHLPLPALVSAMVRAHGAPVDEASLVQQAVPRIVSMGKIVGLEAGPIATDDERIGLRRAWRYLNPRVKTQFAPSLVFGGYCIYRASICVPLDRDHRVSHEHRRSHFHSRSKAQ